MSYLVIKWKTKCKEVFVITHLITKIKLKQNKNIAKVILECGINGMIS